MMAKAQARVWSGAGAGRVEGRNGFKLEIWGEIEGGSECLSFPLQVERMVVPLTEAATISR